jgi:hypothetical protein
MKPFQCPECNNRLSNKVLNVMEEFVHWAFPSDNEMQVKAKTHDVPHRIIRKTLDYDGITSAYNLNSYGYTH